MVSPEMLRRFNCFSPVGEESLKALATIAREECVPAGRQLFGEGDPADTLSLIVEGEVDIRYLLGSGESYVVDTLIAGDILGWSALVAAAQDDGHRHHTQAHPADTYPGPAAPRVVRARSVARLSAFDPGGPAAGRSLGGHPGTACDGQLSHHTSSDNSIDLADNSSWRKEGFHEQANRIPMAGNEVPYSVLSRH